MHSNVTLVPWPHITFDLILEPLKGENSVALLFKEQPHYIWAAYMYDLFKCAFSKNGFVSVKESVDDKINALLRKINGESKIDHSLFSESTCE